MSSALREAIDTTTLGWIKPELDETLRRAREDIEAFVDEGDGGRMRACASHMHQVHGTLRMVELYAPALVAEEMERLALALHRAEVDDRDEACASLMRGAVLLPDYLERLQGGHRDIPIVLLPLLNELRASRGEGMLSESVLFSPDLDRPLPETIPSVQVAAANSAPVRNANAIRLASLREVLANWPEDGAPKEPARLASSLESLLGEVEFEPLRRMLWVAASVAAALRDGAMPSSRSLRQAFGGVEREARTLLSEDHFGVPRGEPTAEPTRQLLYHVVNGGADHPALNTLRQTFELAADGPSETEIEHARGSLSGRNRALLDTVSAAIKEDLLRVKDALDLHLRTGGGPVADLQPQAEALGRVADTLSMMGLGQAAAVVVKQREAMREIVTGRKPADEGALLDVAGALLFVDASLDDQVARLGMADAGDAGEDLLASESRRVLDVVVREAIANFGDARQAFVAFVETNWDHAELAEVPRLLDEVGGALRILDLGDPADYLLGVKRYTEDELIGRRRVPTGQALDTLADALTSLEYYLEAVRDRRPNRENILDIARQSLESLGYWPLPSVRGTDEPSIMPSPNEDEALARALRFDASAPASFDRSALQPTPPVVAAPAPARPAAGFEHSDDIDDDIREVFLEELQEEIGNLAALLPAWQDAPDDFERVRPIRRVFHTLKGSGRLVGAKTLGEFSWKIESLLNRILDGSRSTTPAVIDLVDHAYAALPQLHEALRSGARVTVDLGAIEAHADRLAAGEDVLFVPPAPAPEPEPVLEPETEAEADVPVEAAVAETATAIEVDATPDEPVYELDVADAEATDLDALIAQDAEGSPDAAAFEPAPEVVAIDGDFGVPASVDPVLLEILGAEVNGHLATIELWLAHAQDAPADAHANEALQRAIHTLNGAFAMTEVPVITEITGPAETYVKRLLAAGAPASVEGVEAMAAVAIAIRRTLTALQSDRPRVPPFDGLAARMVALRDALPEARTTPVMDAVVEPVDAPVLVDAGAELDALDLSGFADLDDAVAPDELVRAVGESIVFAEADEPAPAPTAPAWTTLAPGPLDDDLREIERLEAERLDAERREIERLEAERLEAERAAAELAAAERAEAERREAEIAEAVARAAEVERLARERAEAERAEAARLDAERVERERLEAERVAFEQAEAERLAAEQAEAERLAFERAEAERLALEQAEAERRASDEAEAARIDAARVAAEQAEAERARFEAQLAELDRLHAATLEEQARSAREAEEAERAAAADAERRAFQPGREAADAGDPEERRGDVQASDDLAAQRAAEEQARLEDADLAAARADAERIAREALERAAQAAGAAPVEHAGAAHDAARAPEDPDAPLDMTGLDPELLDIFLEESHDILDQSDRMLAQLREAPGEREPLLALQRDLHTLKGGARMAGIMPVGELGHAMETLLEAVAEQRTELGRDGVALLERGFDRLHGMVSRVGERRAVGMPDALIAQFDAYASGTPVVVADAEPASGDTGADAPAPAAKPVVELKPLSAPLGDAPVDEEEVAVRAPQEQVRIRADLLDRLVNYAGEVAIYRARLEQQLGAFRAAIAEMAQTNVRLRDQLRRLEIETEAQIIARYQRAGDAGDEVFDPLELDRFSTLQQLSRALAESAADQTSLQTTLDDLTRQYETLLLQQSRVSSELQEGLMRTRMVPFEALVPRLRRVVRQAAGELGKQVQLKLDGTQGELDRNVLERMTAPLEHMLRNSVAHGLEKPDQRRAAGKPEEGTVRIALRREGSEFVLVISDDGAGLNRDAIRRRGEERGLVRPGALLTNADLDALILEPGFSTADEVSRLAGRGVGMDVVASEVRQLGGTLEIQSTPGQGVQFTLRLPQTLAVTQAVFVRIGESTFAVPIASVRGVGRIARDKLEQADATYRYGDEDYPVHDLGTLIGHAPAKAEGQIQMPLLLIRSGDLRAAVSIDQVVGNREIVVKAVGPQIASIPGIFGATIMGDGRVVVILDVAPLVRRQALLPRDVPAEPAPVVEQRRVPLVMVVDDSVTMRKVTGRVLERHNFEVLTANDGLDALERMADRVPDLMLLDIEMPRMDGYELATAMKADPRLRDVRIVMITSRTGDKHRQRAFAIGVDRYLGKPYQEPELMRNVYDLLGIARDHG